ncbi:prolyl oligopeptidase, N-terminal beta-propeller domain protein, partial [Vibrio parahaemolyticus V-223/04]
MTGYKTKMCFIGS